MRTIPSLILFLFAVACSSTPTTEAAPERSRILDIENARLVVNQCSRANPRASDYWVPSPRQIARLEENFGKLRKLLSVECCFSPAKERDPESYLRQYAGVVVAGRRLIYVNAFHPLPLRPSGPAVPTAAVDVCDGGDGFWGVLYDPESGEFSELAFNGVA